MPFVPDTLDFEGALKAEGVTDRLAELARSIYQQESNSGRNPRTSNAGAVGPMQVIPQTFSRFAEKDWGIENPGHNIRAGLRYIKHLDQLAGGDERLIAAGYYGGEGGLDAARRGAAVSDPRNPNAPNTLQYAEQVTARVPARATGRFVPDTTPAPTAAPAPPATPATPPATPRGREDKPNLVDRLILDVFGDKLAKAPNIQGSQPARFLLGMSDLPIGATQLAANALGFGEEANKRVSDINRTTDAQRGSTGFDPIRLLGNLFNPLPYKAAGAVAPAATLAGKMAQGAGMGAVLGGTTPVTDTPGISYPERAASNAALGGLVGAAAPVVVKGGEFLVDAVRGRLPSIKAGHILRDAAGDTLPAVRQANAAAPPNVTSAQAVAPVARDEYLAAGAAAARVQPTPYRQIQDSQEATRMAALRLVQPNQASAEAARTAASKPLYDAATKAGNVVDTAPILRKIDDLLERQPGNRELVRELTSVRKGLVDSASDIGFGPNASAANAEKVMSTLDGLKAAKANKENKYILGKLIELQDDIRGAIPNLRQAEQTFAERSRPVDQARVIDAMANVLTKPGGGERAGPMLNVLGKGEEALIKKSTGLPRYQSGDLNKVMTPQQMSVVNDIAEQLTRDMNIGQRASAAGPAFSKIVKDHTINYELPNLLNPKVTAYNRIVRALTGNVDEKTMQQLATAMRSGKSANELMNQMPADARKAVVEAMAGKRGVLEIPRNAALYAIQQETNQ